MATEDRKVQLITKLRRVMEDHRGTTPAERRLARRRLRELEVGRVVHREMRGRDFAKRAGLLGPAYRRAVR